MLSHLWTAFKLLLSLALVAAPTALFVAAPSALQDPAFIGVAALLVFFAALPWVSFAEPNRALALSGVVASFGLGFIAVHIASAEFPRHCSGRRRLFCELENLLFSVGGENLAAAPWAAAAALLFIGSTVLLRRLRHSWPHDAP
jgi:hypothetical protein